MNAVRSLKPDREKSILMRSIIFFLPALLIVGLFYIGPLLMTVYFSFTNMSMTGAAARAFKFVGFRNFSQVFADPRFLTSIKNTILFLVFSGILGQQVFGFVFALLMKKKSRFIRRFIGMSVLSGWIIPEIVAAFLFAAFFARSGTLNRVIGLFQIKPIAWLFAFPMVSIVVANIWKGTGYSMLMFQAALDGVPDEIEEAALIDGASGIQSLRHIVIPMIKSTFAVTFVNVTLGTLATFVLIYTLTGGGPTGATTTLSIFMYEQAFLAYQIGYGMAIALILLAIGVVFSLLYIKSLRMES